MRASPRILLVGGGLSSAFTFKFLSMFLRNSSPKFELWEKSHTLGGRMMSIETSKAQYWDMGLQYFSRTTEDSQNPVLSAIYNELFAQGILYPLSDCGEGLHSSHNKSDHFMSPMGTSSIIYHALQLDTTTRASDNLESTVLGRSGNLLVRLQSTLQGLTFNESSQEWSAIGIDQQGRSLIGIFDVVILSIPSRALQHLRLPPAVTSGFLETSNVPYGSASTSLSDFLLQASTVQYSKR